MGFWDSLFSSGSDSSFWSDFGSSGALSSGGGGGTDAWGLNWGDLFSGSSSSGGNWWDSITGSGSSGSSGGLGSLLGGGGSSGSSGSSGSGIFGSLLSGLSAGAAASLSGKDLKESILLKGQQDRLTLAQQALDSRHGVDFEAALKDYYAQQDKRRKRVAIDTYGQFSTINKIKPGYVNTPMPETPAKPGYT